MADLMRLLHLPTLYVGASLLLAPALQDAHGHKTASRTTNDVPWRQELYCGVNCLYVMLNVLGVRVTYDQVVDETHLTASGTDMAELQRVADKLGLHLVAVRATAQSALDWPLPAIIHQRKAGSRTGHFVLLLDQSKDSFTILDSNTGQVVVLGEATFLNDWSGYVLLRSAKRSRSYVAWIVLFWMFMGAAVCAMGIWRAFGRTRAVTT
jgi:ABC-type bacteriocin/lantibiotic exporter with double-glycine peptidase domain